MMQQDQIPVLETERLRLRGIGVSDFAPSYRMWRDPAVVRYISGRPAKRGEAWSRVLRYAGHWALLGFGYWVIEDKATGAFVGEAGFANFERDIAPSLDGIPEIGWALNSEFHGRGLATEAVRTIVRWGDSHLDAATTACIINPANLASITVAEKCGYISWATAEFEGEPTLLLQRQQNGTAGPA